MLARTEPGAEVAMQRLDLSELVREAVADTVPLALARGTQFELFADAPVFVAGDRAALRVLVYNLADNAVRYNHAGGRAKLTVAAGGGEARLVVRDTGPGIPPEHQERIFERFYRIDKGRSKAMGGTGLGLAIVKHVAGQYHAVVEVQSEPDVGTTFIVTFPPAGTAE